MVKNLILDWSGTLVDDLGATLVATNEVFAHHGLEEFDLERFRRDFRLPYPEFYEEFLPGTPLEELEVLFKKSFLEAEHLVVPLPNTHTFLAHAAKRGVRLFVLSSMNEEALSRQAEAFGLTASFEGVEAGVLDKRTRMTAMVTRYELDPRETAYVGDMVHDVEAARSAGLHAIAVLSGYDPVARLAAAEPDLIAPHVGKLLPLLDSIAEKPVRPDLRIRQLRVRSHIGVPPEERVKAQELKVTLAIEVAAGIIGLEDDFSRTIDYYQVAERIKTLAGSGERQLIENLAEEIADFVLKEFGAAGVKVEVDKPILANCEGVVATVQKRAR
jgi:phosphoglycolate phosphatase